MSNVHLSSQEGNLPAPSNLGILTTPETFDGADARSEGVETAITFLRELDDHGWHNLVAIHPERGDLEGKTFPPGSWKAMRAWITARIDSWNLYYSVNEPRPDAPDNKLGKANIGRLRAVQVDIDPDKKIETTPEGFAAERERILNSLLDIEFFLMPSYVVDSGGGYQGLWKFSAKLEPAEFLAVESQNRGLCDKFDGDPAATDISRILRLPGTLNLPDAKKKARGRKPAMARLLDRQGDLHHLESLAKWVPPIAGGKKSGSNSDAEIAAARRSIDMDAVRSATTYNALPDELRKKFEDLRKINPKVDQLWNGDEKAVLTQHDDTSRSQFLWSLGCYLPRNSFSATEFAQLAFVWETISTYHEDGKFDDAREVARIWVKTAKAEPTDDFDAERDRTACGDIAPAYSDDALALLFAERHVGDLRHIAAWDKWLAWDGSRWAVDETRVALDRSRDLCRAVAGTCNKPHAAKQIASSRTAAACLHLARADRRLATTVEQFDASPWLLNTAGGVIDLETGEQRPHDPGDHLTRITAAPAGGACPTWRKFLDDVTSGDTALQEFLARMCGYCLTGSTREHALFFLYGTGANGKSVFVNTVAGILGDYARIAPIETFTASPSERHPTELAMLRGARLVTATETEEGRRWAEAKIKALTGGDKISARFMRQDFFEFTPQFKLVISGNHKPGLRSVDEAIRRRFHLVPFAVTIPPERRDDTLADRLKDEWPGILQWMVKGCLDWQVNGLEPPERVTKATAEYLEEEDSIATWVGECCERDPSASAGSSDLHECYSRWAKKYGEPEISQRKLSQGLEARGFRKDATRIGKTFRGLRTRPDEVAELFR